MISNHCSITTMHLGKCWPGLPAVTALLVTMPFLLFGIPASAQSGGDGAGRLEEVVVTASKRGLSTAQELSFSVVAFDQGTLDKMGVAEFTDFSRSVPGLDVIDLGPNQKRYIIRGISGPGESTVGLYQDNIPLTGVGDDATEFGTNQVDLDIFDSQAVEVLRGPQGTLYGTSSVSGVVRVISNKPSTDSGIEGRLQLDAAAVKGGDPNSSAKVMLNIPLGDDFAVRAVAYRNNQGGWLDNNQLHKSADCFGYPIAGAEMVLLPGPGCDDGSTNFENVNKHEKTGIRLQGLYDGWENSSLLAQFFYQDTHSDNRNGTNPIDSEYFIGPPFITGGNRFFTGAAGDRATNIRSLEPHDDELTIAALEWATDFENSSLLIAANYLKRDVVDNRDSSSPARLWRRFKSTPLGPWRVAQIPEFDRDRVHGVIGQENITVEARWASQFDGSFNFLTGVFYQDGTNDSRTKVYSVDPLAGEIVPGTPLLLDRIGEVNTKNYAWFGELYWDVTDNIEVLGGFRTFKTERLQESEILIPLTNSIIGGMAGIEDNDPFSKSDTIFKGQVTWHPNDDMQAYLQVAQGFRAGGVNARIVPGIPASFDPDETLNYEIGYKSEWNDGRLRFNAAFYQIDWDNMQISASFSSQYNGMVNCTEVSNPATSTGWEVEIEWLATDNFEIGGRYSKLDGSWNVDADDCLPQETLDILADPLGAVEGDRLVGVPDWSGSAYFEWDFPVGDSISGYVRGDLQLQGTVQVNEMREERNIESPSYAFGHIRAGLEWENYSIALYVNNVTDEKAWLSFFNTFQQENRVTPSQPRTIGLTFDWYF